MTETISDAQQPQQKAQEQLAEMSAIDQQRLAEQLLASRGSSESCASPPRRPHSMISDGAVVLGGRADPSAPSMVGGSAV